MALLRKTKIINGSSMPPSAAIPTAEEICQRASVIAFGKALIQNDLRGLIAEIIVEYALGSDWKRCSGDWLGWDLEHFDGTRLEVKQSAAKQTWAAPKNPSPPTFDIRSCTGYYIGSEWHPGVGRNAHIYVFAYHPIANDTADHRDPQQWSFRVVATDRLPAYKTIGLARLCSLSPAIGWCGLFDVIEAVRLRRGSHSPLSGAPRE